MKRNSISIEESMSTFAGHGAGHKLQPTSTEYVGRVWAVKPSAPCDLTYTLDLPSNQGTLTPITIPLVTGEIFYAPMINVTCTEEALLILRGV